MSKWTRFRKFTSDRSGFDTKPGEQLVDDGPYKVSRDERDDPPPSKKSLGGRGEVSQGDYFRSSTSTAIDSGYENPTFFITAAGGITPTFSHPYMRVVGSNEAITITANPSISAGVEGNFITLFGAGSSITINNGNGVSLMGSMPIVLNSGAILTLMFNSANAAWNETSRVSGDFGIGG